MRIGMILDEEFPPDPRVENEAIALIKAKHEVHLYCVDYSGKQKKEELINGIHVHRTHFSSRVRKLSALAYTLPLYHLLLLRSIRAFIKKNKLETIHIHDMRVARSVYWLNRSFRLPTVLDIHDNSPEMMHYYAHANTVLGKLLIYPSVWKRFETRYIRRADHVITVSEIARDFYLENINVVSSKFYNVTNTVRKHFYTNATLNTQLVAKYEKYFTILYMGDTSKCRGIVILIDALHHLIPHVPNLKIVIVGTSKEQHLLEEYIKRHKMQEYVDLEGWKDFNLFPSYAASADIGVSLLPRSVNHDGAYPNKLFQYMSFGIPVVVSDCLAQQQLVNDNESGLVFADGDVEDFSRQVIRLYEDDTLRKVIGQNAANAIEKHLRWDKANTDLLSIYADSGIYTEI